MTVQTKIILSFCLVVVTLVIVVWDHAGVQRQATAATNPELADLSGGGPAGGGGAGTIAPAGGASSGGGAGSLPPAGGDHPSGGMATSNPGAVASGDGANEGSGATGISELGPDTVLLETPGTDPDAGKSGSVAGTGKTKPGLPSEGLTPGRPGGGKPSVDPDAGTVVADTTEKAGTGAGRTPATAETPAGPRTYKVRPGDYPWKIAQKVYGDGQQFKLILAANKGKINAEGTNLKVGMELVIPPLEGRAPAVEETDPPVALETGQKPLPDGTSGPTEYVIQPGDNLSRISQQFYGTSSRWNEIYEANTDRLSGPDDLTVGEAILIPAAK